MKLHYEKLPVAFIRYDGEDPTLAFAAGELRGLLRGVFSFSVSSKAVTGPHDDSIVFDFFVDTRMAESEMLVRSETNNGLNRVLLSAPSSAGVLRSVYTMLEEIGIIFDITGPITPERLNIGRLYDIDLTIKAFSQLRGIRQHINFPMDISSYTIDDAREYIRNLARMRFNHITFHSYPGQWYEAHLPDKTIYAGGFFYDRTHEIPDGGVVRNTIKTNDKFFCVPEIEPWFQDKTEKSRKAVAWLADLMNYSKGLGFSVQFSIELRDEGFENSIAICEEVTKQYPMIDTLELITQECGAWQSDSSVTGKEIRELIGMLFGPDTADDNAISPLITDGMWQMPTTLKELANHIRVSRELGVRWSGKHCPRLTLGIYTTDHASLKILLALLRKFAPEGTDFAFLPAHGSRGAMKSINAMELTAEDLGKTVLYSWIEFDGSMFLQQNSVLGIQQLIEYYYCRNGEGTCRGFALNHWRTAENRTAFRYLSLACLYGPIQQDRFYADYAKALGITSVGEYATAMKRLDEADIMAMQKTGNIGFCHEPCWLGKTGMGQVSFYRMEDLDMELGEYAAILELLDSCRVESDRCPGKEYIDFLKNRVACSMELIRTVRIIAELKPLYTKIDERGVSVQDRAAVDGICDRAMECARSYLDIHSRMMTDRGCEGTLISFFYTLPVYILKLKARYGNGAPESVYEARTGMDLGPPPPAI